MIVFVLILRLLQEEPNINVLTALFFTLVFFAATQGALSVFQ